jgi:hypothetical protein
VTATSRLLRAWLLTAIIDGLFACVQAVFSGSTVTRLFQGVASTLLGADAYQGGVSTALVGLLMHFGVALGWSVVFLALYSASAPVRRLVSTRAGVVAVAAVYGPMIWAVMSLLVIPMLTGRPPSITPRWWGQLAGHFPFVGLPIVGSIAIVGGNRPGHTR